MILPLEMIWNRVDRGRDDSDTTLFLDLLYSGEMVLKLTVAALTASLEDDRERHRYRILHRLVRADGLGDWSQALDDVLTGPASQHMCNSAKDDRRSLTERLGTDTWQYEAVSLLFSALKKVIEVEAIPTKAALRQWFSKFPELRNKTRAHGAPTPALCAGICPELERSIRLICDNLPTFNREWAYLHRNLSGKYRVLKLGQDAPSFEFLKKTSGGGAAGNFPNGVYVRYDDISPVELLVTSVDLTDFYFPNGVFTDRKFELHSLGACLGNGPNG
jgi:hypothetical protein